MMFFLPIILFFVWILIAQYYGSIIEGVKNPPTTTTTVEDRLTNLETKVSGLDTEVTGLTTSVTGLDAKIDGLDPRVFTLEGQLKDLITANANSIVGEIPVTDGDVATIVEDPTANENITVVDDFGGQDPLENDNFPDT